MSPKLTASIGDPIAELPLTVTQGAWMMWEGVAAACRANPGRWVPITIPGIEARRGFKNITTRIRRNIVPAFREGTWDAARKGDTIFVQLVEAAPLPDPDAELIDELCKLADTTDYLAQVIATIRARDVKAAR